MAVDPVLTMANSLLACLEQKFAGITGPPGDFCLRAGEQVSEDIDPFTNEDLCCSGLGWVRIGGTFPSSNFLEPDGALKRHGCLPTGWAQELEVGVLRCYTPGADARIPTCAEHTTAATNYASDMMVIKNAICCWVETLPKGRLYAIQSIVPSGPRSNCIQTVGSIIVHAPKCC
jgi:hypothetical protein